MHIEIIGLIATALAIVGVLANNRRLRWCFIVWAISNILSGLVHVHAEIWSLVIRDGLFFILALEGWNRWGR